MDLTLQRVLLRPHDVDQGALQRMHVQAVIHPGPILWNRVEECVNICAIQKFAVELWDYMQLPNAVRSKRRTQGTAFFPN